ncbi:MAG: DUF2239 family protein [Bradyrhizobiaceae bacterium]|nr:MAG: DUF2239 family protein [Bradyrhizobiaceae bacterium]
MSEIIAFDGNHCISSGPLASAAKEIKVYLENCPDAQILAFDSKTSQPVEIDLRGSAADVHAKLPPADEAKETPRGPGRPKLGVIAREITLLPRHWEWLAKQPGGASVAIRKLIEEARKSGADAKRTAQESAYRFITAMAGNAPHYEEALRALFANEDTRFHALTESWPRDIRDHARTLAQRAFEK